MAVDIYDSQYLLILAPSLVIVLMFLFFWLFMKETSYDEVLAKQKRDLKLPPSKPDIRKKSEKKKNKKKESVVVGGGGGGGGGGELEEGARDRDVTDAATSSTPELEEEPPQVPPAAAAAAPPTPTPTPTPAVPVAAAAEAPTGPKEKKKSRKAARSAAAATTLAAATGATTTTTTTATNAAAPATAAVSNSTTAAAPAPAATAPKAGATIAAAVATEVSRPPSKEPKVNGAKPASLKTDPPAAARKQPSPPPAKVDVQVLAQTQAPVQGQTPSQTSGRRRERRKQKAEPADDQQAEAKVEQAPAPVQAVVPTPTPTPTPAPAPAPAPVKKETTIVVETKALDGAPPSTTSGKKKSNAKKQKTEQVEEHPVVADSAASANHQTNDDAPVKPSGKKQKKETDNAERPELKLKGLLSGLSSLTLSEAEVISVVSLLKEKNRAALDAWHKSTARADPATQERERLLTTLQEEASIAKDKVKQLSQELQVEKQKANRMDAMMRDQRLALEKELGTMQAKAQGSYQELQTMQMTFQQVREQLDSQISRLQQENTILRDAVSTATNQMESKNSAELNKLRSDYAGMMKELADNTNKLQQEEQLRKSLEVNYKQNVSQLEAQLQDAKRRWEELQNYLHNVNAEREKLQATKQELHSQLVAMETEMNTKHKEVQNLHSNLTDAIHSKEKLEQKVLELLEASQHANDSMQVQELLNENKALSVQMETLQVQNENLQAQLSSHLAHVGHFEELQKLLAEKELQRKSLEDSLNAERSSGASKETNMQALHNENMSLKAEIQSLQAQISEQAASKLAMDQIQKSVQEREENMKTVEELLRTGLIEMANKEEELKAAREESDGLRHLVESLQTQIKEQPLIMEELQTKIQEKDATLMSMDERLQETRESRERAVQALECQLVALQAELEQSRQKEAPEERSTSESDLQQFQTLLAAKDQQIQVLQVEAEERTRELNDKVEQLQQQQCQTGAPSKEMLTELSEKENQILSLREQLAELTDSLELHRKKNNELRKKNWIAMEALSATESMLQGKLCKAVKENRTALESSQAECRDVLHRLLPHVPLPPEENHQEWLHRFEQAMAESSGAQPTFDSGSGDSKELAVKLREAEEVQRVLQKDCETYKKVLAETEGILQRLQNSVEQEESRWRAKLDLSQGELREMSLKVTLLEQEVERLTDGAELEHLRKDKEHLESELERAERESATYVTEVRELKDLLTELQSKLDGSYTEAVRQNEELTLLKTQLTNTLSKLEAEEKERIKVAGDLHMAQQSVDRIQGELSKVTENAEDVIDNSNLSLQREEMDRKEKMMAGLNQTVHELQQLLQAVSRQLSKGEEEEAVKDWPTV